jgi:hypothetical protein
MPQLLLLTNLCRGKIKELETMLETDNKHFDEKVNNMNIWQRNNIQMHCIYIKAAIIMNKQIESE